MAYKLKKTPQFVQDFRQLTDFYAVQNQQVGERFVESVAKTIRLIRDFPLLGSKDPTGDSVNRRFRGVPRFRSIQIFYVVEGQEVKLRRIVHGARDLPSLLDE